MFRVETVNQITILRRRTEAWMGAPHRVFAVETHQRRRGASVEFD